MDLVVYSQFYRARTPERQLEIEECLRRNLNHPGISRMVVFTENDAPPVPQSTVPVELVTSDERITYAEWFRWVQRQGSGIGLLLNTDIYLDEGLEHLKASFSTPEAFLALTRYNPGHSGDHLNDYLLWSQEVWGVRADAELPAIMLNASRLPMGHSLFLSPAMEPHRAGLDIHTCMVGQEVDHNDRLEAQAGVEELVWLGWLAVTNMQLACDQIREVYIQPWHSRLTSHCCPTRARPKGGYSQAYFRSAKVTRI